MEVLVANANSGVVHVTSSTSSFNDRVQRYEATAIELSGRPFVDVETQQSIRADIVMRNVTPTECFEHPSSPATNSLRESAVTTSAVDAAILEASKHNHDASHVH